MTLAARPRGLRHVTALGVLVALLGSALVAAPVAEARAIAPRDAQVATLNLGVSPHDIAIDDTGTYAYAVASSNQAQAQLIRIDLATFTIDDSVALTGNYGRAVSLVGGTIYATTSDRLFRFQAANFGPSGPSTDDSVEIQDYGNALDVHGSFAYIGHHAGGNANKITKVDVSGPSMTTAGSFPSGGDYPMSLQVDPAGTNLYVVHTNTHTLVKIRLSDDSVIGSLLVGQQPYGLDLDDSGAHAFVPNAAVEGPNVRSTPPWLMRVDLSTFTMDDTVLLPFTWAFDVAVDKAGTTAYVSQAREGGLVSKVSIGQTMSIEQTFSVDNGPHALALSPTAPYLYTANHYDHSGRTISKVAIVGSTPAPTVSSLSVVSGPLGGGGTVTISGDNLTGATGVSFGGAAATILSGTDDTVAVTVPAAGSAGARNVTVTTPGGTSTQNVAFTYVEAPTVASMTPASGPAAGGTDVTISGTDLSGATVDLDGTPVATTSNTSTEIAFTTPPGAGAITVTVTTAGGSASAGNFTFLAPSSPPTSPPALPSAPAAPKAVPGYRSAVVSWAPPMTAGSFGISTYQVTSSPAGGDCLTSTLTCTIDGLIPGTAYTFRVRALTGAGWSDWSTASSPATPEPDPSIAITGSRKRSRGASVVAISGTSNLDAGSRLQVWLRMGGGSAFRPGSAIVTADEAGSFTWSRRAAGPVTVYVRTIDGSARSNRIAIR